MKHISLLLSCLAGLASAQQSLWGQCGGRDWTGPTTCVNGAYCRYQDEWYSQCTPGSSQVLTNTTTSMPATTLVTSTTTSEKTPTVGTGFPKATGTKFTLDGVTKYFAGTNCYWCSFMTNNADVDTTFDRFQKSGIRIIRIWGFNDVNTIPEPGKVYFQHLSASGSTINTGANGLERLDYVVSAAEKRGLKLVINFVNYWDDFGGMNAYITAFGGDKTGWYTNKAAQTQYRKYIEAVVSRFKSSTGILAWELANEPRCSQCSTDVIYNWAKTTSEYVKSLDGDHMVTLGDEGMGLSGDGSYAYTFAEGTDFVKNLGISTLDFGTFHLYPDHWGTSYDWGNQWVKSHAAACVAANKPCFFEEYGTLSNHCSLERPWQLTSVATLGMASDAFWQAGDTISTGTTHDDKFTIYYDSSDWKCLVTDHVAAIA